MVDRSAAAARRFLAPAGRPASGPDRPDVQSHTAAGEMAISASALRALPAL